MSRGGWLAAGALALVTAAVGADVAAGGLLVRLDLPVLQAAARSRTPGLTLAVTAVTDAGGWAARIPLGLLVAGALARRSGPGGPAGPAGPAQHVEGVERWRPVVVTAAALAAGPLASTVLKRVVGRVRPPSELAVITPTDPSFPSGHATGSAALAVVLAALVLRSGAARSRRARLLVVAAAAVYAGAVGASRLYLGAHWLTDVLAGEALGAAVGLVVLQLVPERAGPRLRRSTSMVRRE